MELSRDQGVEKYVLASTSFIYAREELPFSKNRSVNSPISSYATSKKTFGIDVSVVRYFTVFGPAGRPDMSNFRFIKWIDEGKPIKHYGDGSQSRYFTYVDDIAEGTIKALKRLAYEIINLGGGRTPLSLKIVIELIDNNLGKKTVIDNKDFQETDMKEARANISKINKYLDWKPEIGFEEGLEKYSQLVPRKPIMACRC